MNIEFERGINCWFWTFIFLKACLLYLLRSLFHSSLVSDAWLPMTSWGLLHRFARASLIPLSIFWLLRSLVCALFDRTTNWINSTNSTVIFFSSWHLYTALTVTRQSLMTRDRYGKGCQYDLLKALRKIKFNIEICHINVLYALLLSVAPLGSPSL